MSIDFTGVKSLSIPEGKVIKVIKKSDGTIVWEAAAQKNPTFAIADYASGLPIEDCEFEFEEGMSWVEWANSEYNTYFVSYIVVSGSNIIYFVQHANRGEYEWVIYNGNDLVTANEQIIDGHQYDAVIEFMGPV